MKAVATVSPAILELIVLKLFPVPRTVQVNGTAHAKIPVNASVNTDSRVTIAHKLVV